MISGLEKIESDNQGNDLELSQGNENGTNGFGGKVLS
jgi:hypothetical protein